MGFLRIFLIAICISIIFLGIFSYPKNDNAQVLPETNGNIGGSEICLTEEDILKDLRGNIDLTLENMENIIPLEVADPDSNNQQKVKQFKEVLSGLSNHFADETIPNDILNKDLKDFYLKYLTDSEPIRELELLLGEQDSKLDVQSTKLANQIEKWFSQSTRNPSSFPCLTKELSGKIQHSFTKPTAADFANLDLNYFSWQTFLALNWPAQENGEPNVNLNIGNDPNAPRVWELYKDPVNVFIAPNPQADKQDPKYPFNELSTEFLDSPTEPKACTSSLLSGQLEQVRKGQIKVLAKSISGDHSSKGIDFLQALPNAPLIDQNGNYVVYETRINQDEFNYIVANRLYDADAQSKISPIQFPAGGEKKFIEFPDGSTKEIGSIGAMEIKAAWRIFPEGTSEDIKNRYYTKKALIYIPQKYAESKQDICNLKTVGLVGLHIIHKTQGQPQWVWATFEHIDNTPDPKLLKEGKVEGEFAFWSKCNTGINCAPNNEPKPDLEHFLECNTPWKKGNPVDLDCLFSWSTQPPYANKKQYQPTQVVRENLIFPNETAIINNHEWHLLLNKALGNQNGTKLKKNSHSVWQNYQLIGTQWRSTPSQIQELYEDDSKKYRDFDNIFPEALGNTTMETYIQRDSCIKCHAGAKTAGNNHQQADFSFLLDLAKSVK